MTRIFLKINILSILVLLLSITAFAQKGEGQKNSLLWKISQKGQKEVSYLFGTIHVICKEDYFWTKPMQSCYDQCNQLCLEVNISDQSQMTSELAALMFDMTGGTLRDYFSKEEDYNIVAKFIQDSMKQNIEMANRMKPITLYFLYNTLLAKGPCKESLSYELQLVEKSKSAKKEIIGLETFAEQMTVLEKIPTDTIINQMIGIAKGEKNESSEVQQLVDAYKKQDLLTLNKFIVESAQMGMNSKSFIDERNQKWVAPMKKMMDSQPTFFAVGAGHISGLIELLRAEGFTVEAIY
ncbi:MAG: TraB/GumN family protein [Phycisphaerales bacterium]|nr:TraB/GumN family protein [Phycisphaerales bacterium]